MNNTAEIITSKRNFKAANEIHLKFVDDLTVAEAINLKNSVNFTPVNERPQPDNYHSRTGHTLKPEVSNVFNQIEKVIRYAADNEMKVNTKKTKFILFNNAKNTDFEPNFSLEKEEIDLVEQIKILGVIISSDLKWSANTKHIIANAFKRVWMLRRLKSLGTELPELKDIYIQQVRSVLEFAVPVWHSGLTQGDSCDIERVQKAALHVMLGDDYASYSAALKLTHLDTLESRRRILCSKFASRAVKHPKHKNWFKLNDKISMTSQSQPKVCPVVSRTERFCKGPIGYLTDVPNLKHDKLRKQK